MLSASSFGNRGRGGTFLGRDSNNSFCLWGEREGVSLWGGGRDGGFGRCGSFTVSNFFNLVLGPSNRWKMKNTIEERVCVSPLNHHSCFSGIITKLDNIKSVCRHEMTHFFFLTPVNADWYSAGRQTHTPEKKSSRVFTVWTDAASFSMKGARFSAAFSPSWKKLQRGEKKEQMLSHGGTRAQTSSSHTNQNITCWSCISNSAPTFKKKHAWLKWANG